ncbi:MAG TPA: aspartate aminotransferase family protein, partial [Kofleriaceae bacterium]|nr:aspartate aminotransferase family protein [Kofleriaceae bacterium]
MGEHNPDANAIEAADEKYVMRPWAHPAGEPVIIAKARGCVVTDVHGKDYLDLTAGYFVNNAGHCHPRIIEAVTKQLHEVLQVSGKHGTIPAVRLAEKLVNLAPKSIHKAFFSTGGSESNEFALKLARQFRKKPEIAYLENGYHGLTLGSLEVTASQKYRESAGKPLGTDNYAVPTAYCYRCKFGPHAQCKVECLDGIDAIFDAHPETAGLIAEPIQAVGGLAPPQKWWDRMDAARKKRGILFIADEIQTGMGRTGKMWGVDHWNVVPDIMCLGKSIGGGVMPLSAFIANPTVWEVMIPNP